MGSPDRRRRVREGRESRVPGNRATRGGTQDGSTENQPSAAINPNKALWEKGDFTRIAATMRESGEALVSTLGITEGLRGPRRRLRRRDDGRAGRADSGADVLGVDIASNLVAAGNDRARSLGLTNCRFQEGDASDLRELDDDSFDLVVSIFGAMFAPRPADVAKEIVRVTRPGGRIVMGNWIPGDPTLVAQILKISSSYSPPPPDGFVSPMTWGLEDNVIERFAGAGVPEDRISFERDTYTFTFPGSPSELLDEFRTYYGPTMNAYEAAGANGREAELHAELDALFNEQNASSSPDRHLHPGHVPEGDRRGLISRQRPLEGYPRLRLDPRVALAVRVLEECRAQEDRENAATKQPVLRNRAVRVDERGARGSRKEAPVEDAGRSPDRHGRRHPSR